MWEAGGLTLDDEGIELRDIKAVQDAAVRSLADMAREPVNSGASVGHDMAIEVRDTDGTVLQVKLTLVIERPIIANGQGRAEVNMRGGSSAPNSNISRPAPFQTSANRATTGTSTSNASAAYLPFIHHHSRNALARIPCRNASAHNPDRNVSAHNLDRNAFARSRDPHHVWAHCRFVQKPHGTDR